MWAGEAGEIRCEIRFAPKQVWTLWGRAAKSSHWKGGYWGAKFTPRGTTYVFVNVVVAPRYVARVQPGSGGLKLRFVAEISTKVWEISSRRD